MTHIDFDFLRTSLNPKGPNQRSSKCWLWRVLREGENERWRLWKMEWPKQPKLANTCYGESKRKIERLWAINFILFFC